jgi:hypothetical protein
VDETRGALAAVEERIATHVWVAAAEAGDLTREDLGLFGREQVHIIGSDRASFAIRAGRAREEKDVAFFSGSVEFEGTALEMLKPYLRECPPSPEATAGEGPLPGTFAYAAFVAWMADRVTDAEYVGAFLINLPVWGANCGRLAAALRERYGLDDDACAFFDLFAGSSPEWEEKALDVIERGIAGGVDPAGIARCARLLQGYELMYWDTLHAERRA